MADDHQRIIASTQGQNRAMQHETGTFKLSKFSGKNNQSYLERFQLVIKPMECYHIVPSQNQQVIVSLKGFKNTRLTPPILELRQKHSASIYSDWTCERNLCHTMERARNYCTLVNQYTPAVPPCSTVPQPQPTQIPRANSKSKSQSFYTM